MVIEYMGEDGMAFRRPKTRAAVTLIEVMAAIVIVSIAVLGACGYRDYSTLDAKRADMQSTAARIALLLCENRPGGAVGLKSKVPLLCVGK